MMLLRSKEIIIGGVRMRYFEQKVDSEVSLVFLHGWRSEGRVWIPTIESLPNFYSSYVLDLPGFGGSESPPHDAGLDFYAGFIAEFVSKLMLREVVLIGHSFGGRIAIALAAAQPLWLKELVLVGAAGKEDRSVLKGVKIFIAKVLKPVFRPRFMQKARRKIYKLMGAEDYVVVTPGLRDTFVRVISEDLTARLSLIACRTLIIFGEHDKEVPVTFMADLRDGIRSAKFISFSGAGHYPFIDQPGLFRDVLVNFLGEGAKV